MRNTREIVNLGDPIVEQLPPISPKFFLKTMGELAVSGCSEVNPDTFHAIKGEKVTDTIEAAKKVCSQCVINTSCRNYAIQNPDVTGVWGGLTDNERKSIRRKNSRISIR